MKTHTMPDGTVMPGASHAEYKEKRPVAMRDSKKKYQMTDSAAKGEQMAKLAKAMGLKK